MGGPIVERVHTTLSTVEEADRHKRVDQHSGVTIPPSHQGDVNVVHAMQHPVWAVEGRGNPQVKQIACPVLPKHRPQAFPLAVPSKRHRDPNVSIHGTSIIRQKQPRRGGGQTTPNGAACRPSRQTVAPCPVHDCVGCEKITP